ncbi:MAG: DUF4823 domain-containing protein [Methylotenera sp.]|nr:DUF4823 domain-containing protein [Methylotenera sp.]
MRLAVIIISTVLMSGCAASYKQSPLSQPSSKLLKGKSVIISTPTNGSYENKTYIASGKTTALAIRTAFAKFSNNTKVIADCSNISCLKTNVSSDFDYYVIPEILHWEDRNTEWSGISDKVEIKVSVYDGKSWNELASTIISGKSKWMTLGGDHPQDLLPELLHKYIESLY